MDQFEIKEVIILANGKFPKHAIPLKILNNAPFLVSCDGSIKKLHKRGIVPDLIIGDLDSIPLDLKNLFTDKVILDSDQETNDLTKAVNWCLKNGFNKITILGATGKREDHTLGNISLLAEYGKSADVEMITNSGRIFPIYNSSDIKSFAGQIVSIFSLDPNLRISSKGLKYPLNELKLGSWWKGTLNTALSDIFNLQFEKGILLIFQSHSN